MNFPKESAPSSHDRRPLPARSLLLQSALLRCAGAFALCGTLAVVLVWATRPMA